MIVGDRIRSRLAELGMSQSELARRVNLTQGTIGGLLIGKARGSTHLHRIARELGTSPAYLEGEIDDPNENAPPPRPKPTTQQLMLPVSLPSQPALAAAFAAILMGSRSMSEPELAEELAKRLPLLLRVAGGEIVAQESQADAAPPEYVEALHNAPRAARRA